MDVRDSSSRKLGAVPSAGGLATRLACVRLTNAGIQLTPLLSKAGLTEEVIKDSGAPIKVQSQIKFLEAAGHALQDDFLGFNLASDFELREIGLLYYVLASSEILGDSVRRVERYCRLANEGMSLRVRTGKELTVAFDYVGIERLTDRHQIEFWLTSFVRLCRELTKRRLVPSRVRVMHQRRGDIQKLRSLLGCDVEFGSNADEIAFPALTDRMPVLSADPYLNELLIKYCEEALANKVASRGSVRPDVQNAIAAMLPHGKVRAADIARKLGMSQRTLVRRLTAEGLSFTEVMDDLKRELANHYLRDQDLAISRIAWLVGYREVSAFTHAFKRWTGKNPRDARSQETAIH